MEIVTEGLDVRNVLIATLGGQVTREKDCSSVSFDQFNRSNSSSTKSNIANIIFVRVLQPWNTLQLQWGVAAEEDLRRIL